MKNKIKPGLINRALVGEISHAVHQVLLDYKLSVEESLIILRSLVNDFDIVDKEIRREYYHKEKTRLSNEIHRPGYTG